MRMTRCGIDREGVVRRYGVATLMGMSKPVPSLRERLRGQMRFWTPASAAALEPYLDGIASATELTGGGMEAACEEVKRLAAFMGRQNPWTES